jgi:outer membrane protein assembly factor BamB
VLPDGDILVLTREAHVVPEFDPERPVLEDFVTLLDREGREKRRFSLLEALDRSPFRALAAAARARRGDVLHTNSLEVLGQVGAGLPAAFRAGRLLVSSRTLSFIGVVDPEREELLWTMQGAFREQHDPKLLPSGRILLFDNAGRGVDASRVLELDPATGATLWEFGGTPAAPFVSRTCGTAERLANGNTLVTESDSGRAFELAPDGAIVWEFWNPERAGPEGEFIATLFEVVRLAPDFPRDWLR